MKISFCGKVMLLPNVGDRVVNYEGKRGRVYGIERSSELKPIVMVNMDAGGARWFLPHHIAWAGDDADGTSSVMCIEDRVVLLETQVKNLMGTDQEICAKVASCIASIFGDVAKAQNCSHDDTRCECGGKIVWIADVPGRALCWDCGKHYGELNERSV